MRSAAPGDAVPTHVDDSVQVEHHQVVPVHQRFATRLHLRRRPSRAIVSPVSGWVGGDPLRCSDGLRRRRHPMSPVPWRFSPFRACMLAPAGRRLGSARGSRDPIATSRPTASSGRAATGHVTDTSRRSTCTSTPPVDSRSVASSAHSTSVAGPQPRRRAVFPHEASIRTQAAELADRMREMAINPAPILLVHHGDAGAAELLDRASLRTRVATTPTRAASGSASGPVTRPGLIATDHGRSATAAPSSPTVTTATPPTCALHDRTPGPAGTRAWHARRPGRHAPVPRRHPPRAPPACV